MIKRLFFGLVLIILGGVILSELFLPRIIAKQAEAAFSRMFKADEMQVSVQAHPALSMLGGNFSKITVDGKNLHIEHLVVSQLSVVFTDASIDLDKLMASRTLAFRNIGDLDGTVIMREEDINKSVAQTVKGIKNVHVTLGPENMKVTGEVALLGSAGVPVTMNGKLWSDQKQLKYHADQISVNNVAVGSVGSKLSVSGITEFPVFDMKKLPVEASIRSVETQNGQVVIRIGK